MVGNIKIYLILFFFIVLTFFAYQYFFINQSDSLGNAEFRENCGQLAISFVPANSEVEPKFLITDDNNVIFSVNDSNYFSLYSYSDGKIEKYDTLKNVMYPFLFNGEVTGLQDNDGDEYFKSTHQQLNELLDNRSIENVFSFRKGELLVLQLKGDNAVYLIDLLSNKKSKLLDGIQSLHHADLMEAFNFLVLSYDDTLAYIDLNIINSDPYILYVNHEGTKMIPFINSNKIYFSSNRDSEYYKLYCISINRSKTFNCELVHEVKNDIKLPKLKGNYLYYIEIVNNEYLLKNVQLSSGEINSITNEGVVYNYDFFRDQLVFVYSNFDTPKSLVVSDYLGKSATNIVGKPINLSISYRLIDQTEKRSPSYEFSPPEKKELKGVILFFHPGLNGDFSPRWDTMLNNLCNNGYVIVSPNYPMSSGLGKSHSNADFSAAVTDMQEWKNYLLNEYDHLPLYFLSASSGNLLMEQVLLRDSEKVRASASMFGLTSNLPKNPTTPHLFILGKNDPVVNSQYLINQLNKIRKENSNINYSIYSDEGHWFRKSKNAFNALNEIICFFEQ